MHLCADECITVSIDTRTGRILLRDTGGLAAAGRAPSYSIFTEKINDNPFAVYEFLVMARFNVSVFPNVAGGYGGTYSVHRLLWISQNRRLDIWA